VGLGLAAAFVTGCAPAVPSLAGGSTTPFARGDALTGAAARIPLGKDRVPNPAPSRSALGASAGSGGVVPVVGGRYGLARHLDVGLTVAGTNGRLSLRREIVLEEAITRPTVLVGAGVTAGYVEGEGDQDGAGWRAGVEVPLLYAVEFGAVYELWTGLRAGAEHLRGDFTATDGARGTTGLEDAHATSVRAGATLGLALGLRRFHALVEVTASYEHWWGAHGSASEGSGVVNDGGFVLVPAFALRLRI
jgi:hypothetical protein